MKTNMYSKTPLYCTPSLQGIPWHLFFAMQSKLFTSIHVYRILHEFLFLKLIIQLSNFHKLNSMFFEDKSELK